MEYAPVATVVEQNMASDQLIIAHGLAKKSLAVPVLDEVIMPRETKRQQSEDMSKITGKHLIYSYENGWLYEIYVKNVTTMDYRIHSGPVARRWVRNQKVNVVQLSGKDHFKISWAEPTGTAVSLCINLDTRQHHGTIFFPQWVHQHGTRTALFQNDHLDEMFRLRDAGPTYPIVVVDEFAEMILVEDAGVDVEEVISISPTEFAPTLEEICKENNFAHKLAHFGENWGSRDTSHLVGKLLAYTYENGWYHELYVRSASSIDYKIRSSSGAVLHLTKGQEAFIVRLTGPNNYIISWTDPTGISVSLTLDLDMQQLHGVHFVPQWVLKDPKELNLSSAGDRRRPNGSSSCQQNVDRVIAYRDARPTYPLQLVSEFAQISSLEDRGAENDLVIN